MRAKKHPPAKIPKGDYFQNLMAENRGFEPLEACTSIDFKSTAIDRSASSPLEVVKYFSTT